MTGDKVDFARVTRPSMAKALARRVLLLPGVNRLAVAALRLLPAYSWKARIPVAGSATLQLEGNAPVVMLRADRCQVAKEVFWGGGHLGTAADRLALDLMVRLSAGADLFVDIGAYTGLFALSVARRNPTVVAHAYEIVPENFLLMWENVVANDLVGRVDPRLTGLGEVAGSLRVAPSFGGGALASSIALNCDSANGIGVPVTTLDAIYPGYAGRLVMKLDVEGFEYEVLRGGSALLARTRPDMLCEVLTRAPHVPEMERLVKSAGYNLFHVTNHGLVAAPRISPVKHERDWLFTTRGAQQLRDMGVTVVTD